MNLAATPVGEVVTVEQVGGDRSFRRRLMELGLVPGTRVQIIGVAPLGDPLELLVRGCSLSIRRSEAVNIGICAPAPCGAVEPGPCGACSHRVARCAAADDGAADAA